MFLIGRIFYLKTLLTKVGKISTETDSVFRASLPTKDVFSTSPEDFSVHSGFDYPKMEENLVGTTSFTFPATVSVGETAILTVTHNLGYLPMSLVFIEDVGGVPSSNTFSFLPCSFFPYSQGSFRAYTTTTQFKIIADVLDTDDANQVQGKTYKFKYQIWVND